jgi:hypothetical protein
MASSWYLMDELPLLMTRTFTAGSFVVVARG